MPGRAGYNQRMLKFDGKNAAGAKNGASHEMPVKLTIIVFGVIQLL